MREISALRELWEGAELTSQLRRLPKRPRVLASIADTSEVTTVLTRPRIQNPEINTTNRSVMSRKVTEKKQTLASSIDPDSFKALSQIAGLLGIGDSNLPDPEG
jgi:hypothetical protein